MNKSSEEYQMIRKQLDVAMDYLNFAWDSDEGQYIIELVTLAYRAGVYEGMKDIREVFNG